MLYDSSNNGKYIELCSLKISYSLFKATNRDLLVFFNLQSYCNRFKFDCITYLFSLYVFSKFEVILGSNKAVITSLLLYLLFTS